MKNAYSEIIDNQDKWDQRRTRISDSGAKKILTIRLYMLDEIMYLGTSLNATISFTWIRSRKEMTTFVLD
jgi:hypothetical protein